MSNRKRKQAVSRQVRRAEERRARSSPDSRPPLVGRLEIIIAVSAVLIVLALNALASLTDLQAFVAVATPLLLCWLALCLFCSAGLLLAVSARRRGLEVPLYFRVLLALGALAGAVTISPAFRVLTKDDAEAEPPLVESNVDLRNRQVENISFAGRVLRHSDFHGATLEHVDLSGANLSESDFRDAEFDDVDLSAAKLCGADLRGADLRGAKGLDAVSDWSYVFYDGRTRVSHAHGFFLAGSPGPVEDTGRDLLYMCSSGQVRRIES